MYRSAGTSMATPKDEKMQELFDPATRYIAYLAEPTDQKTGRLLGFASIRFDTEDTLDSQEYEDGEQTMVVYM
jgi:hypothetical protein